MRLIYLLCLLTIGGSCAAQTMTDGLMMNGGEFCVVAQYRHESWQKYWEGGRLRENSLIGRITTQSVTSMAAVGLCSRLNLIMSVPYIWTKASKGTLSGQSGFQDFEAGLKFRLCQHQCGSDGRFSLFAVAGASMPVSNYVPDFMPLSIGVQSKTASLRAIADYRVKGGAFVTLAAGYINRSTIHIDRSTYYDDGKLYNSHEVRVPNMAEFTMRGGHISWRCTTDVYVQRQQALKGSDIRRNDMPFPSNAMSQTRAGAQVIYRLPFLEPVSVQASAAYTFEGRNVGQTCEFVVGVRYVFSLWTCRNAKCDSDQK